MKWWSIGSWSEGLRGCPRVKRRVGVVVKRSCAAHEIISATHYSCDVSIKIMKNDITRQICSKVFFKVVISPAFRAFFVEPVSTIVYQLGFTVTQQP